MLSPHNVVEETKGVNGIQFIIKTNYGFRIHKTFLDKLYKSFVFKERRFFNRRKYGCEKSKEMARGQKRIFEKKKL